MIKVPKFSKASEAAQWIADNNNRALDGVTDPEATRFCAIGWTLLANQGFDLQVRCVIGAVIRSVDIVNWNDSSVRTVDEVRYVFNQASKRLAAQGK